MSRDRVRLATQGCTLVLPEYEDLALYAEKTRELRAHLSPFNSLNNWSRRLQGLKVERIGMDMVLSVHPRYFERITLNSALE